MKILYSVTIKIDNNIHEEWYQWMISTHIPDVLKTELFESYRLCKLLKRDEEDDGITYSVQYICPDMKSLHLYTVHHAPRLQKLHNDKYEGKFVAFRTLLEVNNEG